MAKYLKPRRGSKANAHAQNIGLQKGELFMEFPNGYIGKEPGRIVIGDGASSYQSCNYATSATNVFQPFITDPSIYIPRFTNTSTSTGSGSVSPAMTSIEKMGNGSSASTTNLPTIISAVKEALVYHANSITKLNNDLEDVTTNIIDLMYPIGSLYMSANNTNPSTLFGVGTWELLPGNYVLKTIETGNSTTAAAGNTGSTTLTAAQSGLPAHNHTASGSITGAHGNGYIYTDNAFADYTAPVASGTVNRSGYSIPGVSVTVNNNTAKNATQGHTHTAGMPQNIGVYVWKRTA